QAALDAAGAHRLPVLGWTVLPDVAATLNAEYTASFSGHDPADIDVVVTVDRSRQSRAVACHPSQAVPGSVLWRRLELTGDREYLRHQPTDRDLPPVPGRANRTHAGRAGRVNTLMIINGSAYGLDSTYNAVRLAANLALATTSR
ncbi:MAG: hypothetical protein WCG47_29965, partial [Dermatophilaceae bacterium]